MVSSVETEGAAHVSETTRHRTSKYSRARLEVERDHQDISTLCHPACAHGGRGDLPAQQLPATSAALQGERVLRSRPQSYLRTRRRASLHGRAVATTVERVRERQVFPHFHVASAVPPPYGAGFVHVTTFFGERKRAASAGVRAADRMSVQATAAARTAVKTRHQKEHGVALQLHGSAAISAVQVLTAAVVHDGLKLLDAAHEA